MLTNDEIKKEKENCTVKEEITIPEDYFCDLCEFNSTDETLYGKTSLVLFILSSI